MSNFTPGRILDSPKPRNLKSFSNNLELYWEYIFFDIHKEAMLAQLGVMLQLYRRFIHDVLGLWLFDPNPGKYHRKWTAFTLLMQDY